MPTYRLRLRHSVHETRLVAEYQAGLLVEAANPAMARLAVDDLFAAGDLSGHVDFTETNADDVEDRSLYLGRDPGETYH